MFDIISNWRNSDRMFLQQAYGELVGLIASEKPNANWLSAKEEINVRGSSEMKLFGAYCCEHVA